MSNEETKRQLLAALELKKKLLDETKLYRYKPYPRQMDFHTAGNDAAVRERLLKAGNQLGKCITSRTMIEHPDGSATSAGELYAAAVPFPVMAWDGCRAVEAVAVQPIKKPAEPCVRIWMSSGAWFECALKHRVLTCRGYVFAEQILPFVPSLPGCDSESSPLAHIEDVLDWLQSAGGSQGCCPEDLHLCGEQLPAAEGSDRFLPLEPGDALRRSQLSFGSGDQGSTRRGTRLGNTDRLSSLDAQGQSVGQCVESLGLDVCRCAQCKKRCTQVFQPLVAESVPGSRSSHEECRGSGQVGALVDPYKAGNRIIAYQPVGSHDIYDFTVPDYANYITAGVVHHNTLAAAYETAMHLTGIYPDWWDGARFLDPTTGWGASMTSQVTRDTVQRMLVGPPDAHGTGSIPAACLLEVKRSAHGVADALESVTVKHVSGGTSRITLKSYDQGRERFQGETLDFVWFDEEPPLDIYIEGLTRTNATQGIVWLTFTPLLGMSDVVKRFLIEKSPGTHVTNMTIYDVAHYTDAQRKAIIDSYPAHEREARAMGTPTLGSGRIFPLSEEVLREKSVALPNHWPRICGMDFGWDHPTAAAWLAWDRDTDTVHVYDCYRVKEATPLIHSLAINAKGKWIPVAWPHDGLQHDKGSGEQLAEQYRKHDVNMLKDRATFDDGSNGVEAGLMEMLDRMQTGRFKVAAHLHDWWEEFRLYHRKDGKVVKEGDDIMSATRYALMMLRKAKVQTIKREQHVVWSPKDSGMGY